MLQTCECCGKTSDHTWAAKRNELAVTPDRKTQILVDYFACNECGAIHKSGQNPLDVQAYYGSGWHTQEPEPIQRLQKASYWICKQLRRWRMSEGLHSGIDIGSKTGGIFTLLESGDVRIKQKSSIDANPVSDSVSKRWFGDGCRLPEKVDFVFASHILEHQVHPIRFLEDIHANLNANGIAYVEVPCLERLAECATTSGDLILSVHIWHFTLTSLHAIANRAGFKVLSSDIEDQTLREPSTRILMIKGNLPSHDAFLEANNALDKEYDKAAEFLLENPGYALYGANETYRHLVTRHRHVAMNHVYDKYRAGDSIMGGRVKDPEQGILEKLVYIVPRNPASIKSIQTYLTEKFPGLEHKPLFPEVVVP